MPKRRNRQADSRTQETYTTQKYMAPTRKHKRRMWIVEGTTDKERAKQLLAADFTYQLTTPDGTMLFKKPK